MNYFIELVTFKSNATTDQVISAAEEVNQFLSGQTGFISRQLGRTDDGVWHDILYWESQAHVEAAMDNAAASPHCKTFFELIDPSNNSMALFPSLVSTGQ